MQNTKADTGFLLISGNSQALAEPRRAAAPAEAELVGAARRGDDRAFEQLYDSYTAMVHGILLARVPRIDVDDLLQEVFLTVYKRLHTLRDANAFGGWVAMIARNCAIDHLRRARSSEELSEDLAGKESQDERAEAIRIVEVMRTLPEAYCETLILRFVEEMTGAEIAARTGLSPASVRVNLHRGMKLLREKLKIEERK
jgi:RNA polymerase sigma-70 factor, ECF subfamily